MRHPGPPHTDAMSDPSRGGFRNFVSDHSLGGLEILCRITASVNSKFCVGPQPRWTSDFDSDHGLGGLEILCRIAASAHSNFCVGSQPRWIRHVVSHPSLGGLIILCRTRASVDSNGLFWRTSRHPSYFHPFTCVVLDPRYNTTLLL